MFVNEFSPKIDPLELTPYLYIHFGGFLPARRISTPCCCSIFVLEKSRFLSVIITMIWSLFRDSPWYHNLAKELFPTLDFWEVGEMLIFWTLVCSKQEICGKGSSLSGLVVENHCGFCFQDKDYDSFQENWYCCGKSCYYFSKEEKTWERSKKSCQGLHSSLIKIDNKEEQVCLLYST